MTATFTVKGTPPGGEHVQPAPLQGVAALPTPEIGQRDYYDDKLPGFGLRISSTGARSWFIFYRHAGRPRRLTIAPCELLDLDGARHHARELLLKAHLGFDPAAERKAQREAARQAEGREDDSFGTLAKLYLERHAKPKKRSWRIDQLTIDRDLGAWSRRPAQAITPTDIEAVLERIVERGAPVQANRTRAIISKIFNFGLKSPSARLRFGLSSNPVLVTERPHLERARDRVLSADELRALWQALEGEPADSAAVLRLELLTAQRGGEIRTMRREDVDVEAGWWTIPAERAKNGLAHRVPLSAPAVAIVREQLGAHSSAWLFPARHGAHTGTEASPYRASVRKAIERLRERAGIAFRGHDLRRTVASNLASMGVPRLVIGRILNHSEPGVTKVYDRHSYDPEKRQALEAWARRLHAIVTGDSVPKVVPLRSA